MLSCFTLQRFRFGAPTQLDLISFCFVDEQADYFDNVTKLIEETVKNNGGQGVILLCHSMGSPMMLHLLQLKDDAWKEKHIRALVTLAGVWGGTVRALKVYLLGNIYKC